MNGTRLSSGKGALLLSGVLVMAAGILFAGLFSAIGSDRHDALGWDFRATYYPAAEAVADGASPYPDDLDSPSLDRRVLYAYPPTLAFLVTPFTALSVDSAAFVAMLLSFAALMGALALVGVRDVRCFAAVILWAPGWNALETANVSALLALLLALAWRYRATFLVLGSVLGAIVSIKLFLWPLLVWAAFARRALAAALGVVIGLVLTAGSWALIGFAGLRTYPDLLHRVATQASYSVERTGDALGLSSRASYVLVLLVTGVLIALCVNWSRKGDDERGFLAGVAAALAFTPVLWLHYLVLLAIPLAVLRPRFSALWLLPVLLWISPRSEAPDGWRLFLPVGVAAAMFVALVRRPAISRPEAWDGLEAARPT